MLASAIAQTPDGRFIIIIQEIHKTVALLLFNIYGLDQKKL